MSEDMSIESYLAQGGMLSNPANVPPRYRAALLKLMATFVDSELAGAAGFAEIINEGPGIKARIAAESLVPIPNAMQITTPGLHGLSATPISDSDARTTTCGWPCSTIHLKAGQMLW